MLVPYVPAQGIPGAKASLNAFEAFSKEEQEGIRCGNALSILPSVAERLAKAQNQSRAKV